MATHLATEALETDPSNKPTESNKLLFFTLA